MDNIVKVCADKGEVKRLKYIFSDSLDVDPTFVKYQEEYEYCKKVSGLFESYIEMTPLIENQNAWNMDYWAKIKSDLLKNFSEKRFDFMRKVAKVLYAEKIERIIKERNEEAEKNKQKVEIKSVLETKTAGNEREQKKSEKERAEIEAEKRKLEDENRRFDEEQIKRQQMKAQSVRISQTQQSTGQKQASKKFLGAALTVLVIIILIIILKIL